MDKYDKWLYNHGGEQTKNQVAERNGYSRDYADDKAKNVNICSKCGCHVSPGAQVCAECGRRQ